MIAQSIRMALKAILANKLRSFLTMLGIIIGVFSLVVLVALVDGATNFVTSSFSSLGGDYIEIFVMDDKGNPLDSEDIENITSMEEISELSPDLSTPNVTFTANRVEKKGVLYGVNSAYLRIMNLKLAYGRGISASDEDNHVKVAVITYETAEDFFDKPDVVGESITIFGSTYDIVGVLAKAEGTFLGMLMGDQPNVYIPFSCYSRIPEVKFVGYSGLLVSKTEEADINDTKAVLGDYFYERFNNDKDAYSISTQDEVMNILGNVTTVLAFVFGGVAAISLLVGGIGIMNIMLVSVTERTKEIGIRKAIGASTNSILLQFLIEAFVISLTGCLIGLLFSYGLIAIVNAVVKMFDIQLTFSIPFSVVIGAGAFSLLVGLVFGIYPANKAAKKKPIEALRYDG